MLLQKIDLRHSIPGGWWGWTHRKLPNIRVQWRECLVTRCRMRVRIRRISRRLHCASIDNTAGAHPGGFTVKQRSLGFMLEVIMVVFRSGLLLSIALLFAATRAATAIEVAISPQALERTLRAQLSMVPRDATTFEATPPPPATSTRTRRMSLLPTNTSSCMSTRRPGSALRSRHLPRCHALHQRRRPLLVPTPEEESIASAMARIDG